jgi:hypothetical protein
MSYSHAPPVPAVARRPRRAAVSSRASRPWFVARMKSGAALPHARPSRISLCSSGLHFRCPREGSGAPRGRWCGTPHPWRVCSPPVCETERDTPEHLARVSPRPSDVGARALAALHRGCHALGDQHDCLGGNDRSPLRLWSLRSTPSVSRDSGDLSTPSRTNQEQKFRKSGKSAAGRLTQKHQAVGGAMPLRLRPRRLR